MCGFIRKQLFENEPNTEDEFFPFLRIGKSGRNQAQSWWNVAET